MSFMRSKKRPGRPRSKTSPSAGGGTKKRKRSTAKAERGKASAIAVRGHANVFSDLGFGPDEAANLKIRADLMLELRRFIRERNWSQAEAAEFFGETQPRISNLLKGEIGRFSVDKLINMLARAGIRVCVRTEMAA